MQTNQILSSKMIDIVFDGRNKDYGAYELRSNYAKRIKNSLLVTLLVSSAIITTTLLAANRKSGRNGVIITEGPTLTELPPAKQKEKQPDPEPERPKPKEPQTKTVKFTDFKPVKDEDFETPPPAHTDFDNAKIDDTNKDGIDDSGIVDEPSKEPAPFVDNHVIEPPKAKPDPIVEIVEIDAKYPGNWKQFLERNLNPEIPVENNAPLGRYTVVIRFVVDREGLVSDIFPLTAHGFGMEEEAVRVLRKATKWEPAIQNGLTVKAYRKQAITFDVSNSE
jgi:periplasmic protein TonB